MKSIFLLFLVSFPVFAQNHFLFQTDYDSIIRQLEEIHQEHPESTQFVTLGKNDQGNDILGLRIESPHSVESKDVKLVVATHHGNERDAAPLAVEFATNLVDILDSDLIYFSDQLQNSVFYVFPVLNISGYNHGRREEMDALGKWHDPNRDYPDACYPNEAFKLKSIRALAEFVEAHQVSSAVTIHGYVGSFTYPWGFFTENDHTPDHDAYVEMASYAASANGYRIGTHKEVLYPAAGSFEDWAYFKHGTWTMLLEMQRMADFQADVELLLRFFSVAPKVASQDHYHYGSCMEVNSRDLGRSRP